MSEEDAVPQPRVWPGKGGASDILSAYAVSSCVVVSLGVRSQGLLLKVYHSSRTGCYRLDGKTRHTGR